MTVARFNSDAHDGLVERWERPALLRSPTLLNVVALARLFDVVPGVRMATPNAVVGDGDNITAERDGRGWRLVFSRGSGDCPSGCIERTYWTFRVVGDSVEYLGT